MSTLALNIRLVFSLQINEVAEASGLEIERLRKVELGEREAPQALIDFYSVELGINRRLLRVLLKSSSDRFPAFRVFHSWVVSLLNSYIGIALRMAAFDEKNKKIRN